MDLETRARAYRHFVIGSNAVLPKQGRQGYSLGGWKLVSEGLVCESELLVCSSH